MALHFRFTFAHKDRTKGALLTLTKPKFLMRIFNRSPVEQRRFLLSTVPDKKSQTASVKYYQSGVHQPRHRSTPGQIYFFFSAGIKIKQVSVVVRKTLLIS